MDEDVLTPAPTAPEVGQPTLGDPNTEPLEELLVEEISIDGMCGVY